MAESFTPKRIDWSLRHHPILLLLLLFLLAWQPSVRAADTSSVNYSVQVLTPSETPQIYNTSSGLVQWKLGLPIPSEDKIEVTASISTGSQDITGLSLKLDGKPLATATAPPWAESIGAASMTPSDHDLDIDTTLNKRGSNAKLSLKLTIVQQLPISLIPPTQPLVTSVKGDQQVLNQGNVASIDPASAAIVPPVVGANGRFNKDAGVDVVLQDDDATAQRTAGLPVTVNGYTIVEIVPVPGSSDTTFVFSIVRDGAVVYGSTSLIPISGAGVKLQAKDAKTKGLLPGIVKLYVWGVDKFGNFSAPTIVTFNIEDNMNPVMTKP